MTKKNKKDGLVAGDNSIVIGGNMMGSSIVIGDGNTISNQSVNVAPLFKTLEDVVDFYANGGGHAFDVAFETLKNPIGGVAEVVKRIAKKMAEDANA